MHSLCHDFCLHFADDCTQSVTLQNLPDIASCYLTSCTEFHCCVEVYKLRRTFQAVFAIHGCEGVLSIGLEAINVNISLEEYQWGNISFISHTLYLQL